MQRLWVGVLISASGAFACPDCATARAVRAAVYDDRVFTWLAAVSSPFLVLQGAITALLYPVGRGARS